MNPNSTNQQWSQWWILVNSDKYIDPREAERVDLQIRKFARKTFGSGGAIHIAHAVGSIRIQIIVESTRLPAHDPTVVEYLRQLWYKFFASLGPATRVGIEGKLMAGSTQDGKPPQQMILVQKDPEAGYV